MSKTTIPGVCHYLSPRSSSDTDMYLLCYKFFTLYFCFAIYILSSPSGQGYIAIKHYFNWNISPNLFTLCKRRATLYIQNISRETLYTILWRSKNFALCTEALIACCLARKTIMCLISPVITNISQCQLLKWIYTYIYLYTYNSLVSSHRVLNARTCFTNRGQQSTNCKSFILLVVYFGVFFFHSSKIC